MEELQTTQRDVKDIKITRDPNAKNSVPITEIKIDPRAIKALKLDVNMTRVQRREIARKAKVDWKVYRVLEREVMRRFKLGFNLSTGKKDEEGENNA